MGVLLLYTLHIMQFTVFTIDNNIVLLLLLLKEIVCIARSNIIWFCYFGSNVLEKS